MGNNIDERIVQMQFDNEDFNEGVQSSLKFLDKLDEGLSLSNSNRAVSGLNEVSHSLSNLTGDFGSFNGVSSVIDNVTSAFGRLKDIIEYTVISRFTNQIIGAGEQIISSLSIDQVNAGWTKYADKTSAVQTIMAATAKDFNDTGKQMEYVNDQLDKLMWFTDETSYNFVDMVSNIGKFTSQGIDLETSVTAMQGIATWAAISGGNAQNASRAMYNLSQALGLGSVRVQDWMSIENANMATVEFKEQVMETAVAMGTLEKVSDGVYKTIGKNGKEVTAASFRENLKEGWFTSEVLISTLENYGNFTDLLSKATDETNKTATELLGMIDDYMAGTISIADIAEETGLSAERTKELFDELSSSTYDLGRRSFKAAQEAKTFQEALDATKDAVSSQWMKSFEIIFGDYEEAKELWTGLANILWDVFASGGEARNEALAEWRDLGGRDAALEAAANAYEVLASIASVAKKAVDTVFTPATAEQLADITKNVRDFTASIKDILWYEEDTKVWREDSEKGISEVEETTWSMSNALLQFRRILQGALSVVGIGVDAFKALAGGAIFLANEIGKRSGGVIERLASFGDRIFNLRKTISDNNVFGNFINKFKPSAIMFIRTFSTILKNVSGFADDISKFIGRRGRYSTIFESFSDVFNSFVNRLPGYIRKFGSFINGFITSLRSSKIIQKSIIGLTSSFRAVKESLKNAFTELTGYSSFGNFLSSIAQKALSVVTAFKAYVKENKIFEKAIEGLKTIRSGLANNLGFIFKSILAFAVNVKKYLSENGIIGKVFDRFVKVFGKISEKLSPHLKSFKEFIDNFINVTEGTSILEKLFNALSGKLTDFKSKLTELFGTSDEAEGLGSKFKKAIDIVKNAIKSFFTADTSDSESFIDKIKKRLEAFAPITEWFSRMVQNIKTNWSKDGGLLNAAFTVIRNAFMFIFEALGGILSWAREALAGKNVNLFTILKGYLSLKAASGALQSVLSFRDFIGNINETFTSVTDGVKNILTFGQDSKNTFKKLPSIFIKIGASLLLVAGAIFLISSIDPNRLGISIGAIAGIAGLLLVFSMAISKIDIDKKKSANINTITKLFTKIGIALILLSVAMKMLSALNISQIGSGLLAIGGLLVELGIFSALVGKVGKVKFGGVITLALGIIVLVQAMKQIAKMNPDDIVKGLIGVGALLLELAAFTKLTQSKIFSKTFGLGQGLGLLSVVIGIIVLVQAMKQIATVDTKSIIKGLIGIGLILLELAAFTKLTQSKLFSKSFGLGKGLGLLSVVIGITVLVQAMKQLADMNPGGFVTGLVGVGLLLTELLVFLKLASGTSFKIGTIFGMLAVTSAILILVRSMQQISEISTEGIVKGIIGLGLVMLELAGFTAILSKVKNLKLKTVLGVLGLSASMILIAHAFKEVSDISFGGIVKAVVSFAAIFVAITALSKSLSSGTNILASVVIMIGIGAALLMMVSAIKSLASKDLSKTIGVAATLSSLFVAIGATFKLMSGIGVGGTLSAAISLGLAIAAVSGIVAAAAAIGQIPGFDWLMGEGARVLGLIGSAIGTFIGAIVGGLGAGVSLGFPIIGQNLSNFMENASGFFTGLDGIDDNKVSAVGKLVDLILKLTAAELLSGISSFVTGGADISGFAEKLPELGNGISAFSAAVSGLDEGAVTAGTNAGLAITGLVDALPPTSGWMQKITGEADVEGFSNDIPVLGAGIKSFADAVSGIDVDATTNATNAGLAIAGLVNELPSANGWMQKITGEADIEGFSNDIPVLGEGIKAFADAISGMDSDAAINGANAGLAIAGLINELPSANGWMQKITGEADIEGFSNDIPVLGEGIKAFADAVSGIDPDVANNAANVGLALSSLANNLPKENGLAQAIFGSQSLGSFSDDISAFGIAVASYMNSISGFTDSDTAASARIVDTLIDLSSRIPKTGGISAAIFGSEDLGQFSSNIATFASAISNYGTTVSTVDTSKMDAVSSQVQKIIDLSNSISGNNTKKIKNNLAGIVDAFVSEGVVSLINAYDYEGQFSEAGSSFIGFLINSMEASNEQFSSVGKNSADAFLNSISPNSESSAVTAGSNLAIAARNGLSSISAYQTGIGFVQGFINGMAMKRAEANTMAASIGNASLSGLNGSIEVDSPSKATKRSAYWFGEGYISMLSNYRAKAYSASAEIGEESVGGINAGLDGALAIYDILDLRPTITPVLDLSEIESGSNYISSMLNPYGANGYGLNLSGSRIPKMVETAGYSIPYSPDNKEVVDAVNSLGGKIDSLNDNIRNLKLVMDTGVVAGQMVGAMDKELGRKAMLKGRGN